MHVYICQRRPKGDAAHVFAVHFTVGCTLDNKAEHSIAKVSGLTHIAKW